VRYAGIGFMFAPLFHPAMKHAAPVRRELGTRTVFNILGPLTNPARARRQVLGVAHESLVPKMAGALERLETQHALVAHGHGGLDELSVTGPSVIYRVRAGRPVERIEVLPQDFDFEPASMEAIAGGTAVENAAMIRNVLAGEHGPRRDVVLLNAAAALLVADAVTTLQEGIKVAARAIDSGAGMDTLANLVEASRNPGISGVAPRAKTTRTKRGRAA
jgi:anthranilate phosphoribosyltransferase